MNRRVLITGGSGGIGQSVVDKFSLLGWEVNAPASNELNLSKSSSLEEWLKYDSLNYDSVILCAGVNEPVEFSRVTNESLEKHLSINYQSSFKLLQSIMMKRQVNKVMRIVAVSSSYAFKARSRRSQYSSSKAALEMLIKSVAIEYADSNVLANIVRPGFVDTPLTHRNNTKKQIKELLSTIPMHRLAKPDEVANLIYYLASEENTYITGEAISIDGGFNIF